MALTTRLMSSVICFIRLKLAIVEIATSAKENKKYLQMNLITTTKLK